jgi:hypothetical protein
MPPYATNSRNEFLTGIPIPVLCITTILNRLATFHKSCLRPGGNDFAQDKDHGAPAAGGG